MNLLPFKMRTGMALVVVACVGGACAKLRESEVAGEYESVTNRSEMKWCSLILLEGGDYELMSAVPEDAAKEDSNGVEVGRWTIDGSMVVLRPRQNGQARKLRFTSEGRISRLTDGADLSVEKKEYVRLSPAEVETAFARSQKLRLPMPLTEAWRAMGLPEMGRVAWTGHGGGRSLVHFTHWDLTKRQPDGGHYTLTTVFRHASDDGSTPAVLYDAIFAYEYDGDKRPALVLSDRFFFLKALDTVERNQPSQLPEGTPGQSPRVSPSSSPDGP